MEQTTQALFHLHSSVIIGVTALAAMYLVGARLTRARPTNFQLACFAGALASILFALDGPVDALADARMFSAHMLQHLMLSLLMPPLLLLGLPARMLQPLVRMRQIKSLATWLANPLVAFSLFNAVLIWLHNPPVFERMCRDENAHIAMHLTLMVTGTVMWWPLLSSLPELPPLPYPAQMLYLFLLLIPMAAVSAPITLSSDVLYPWYLEGAHPFGIDPLADQVAGGLLMWVGAGCYVILVFSLVFFRWAQHEDSDEPVMTISSETHAPLAIIRGR